MLWERNQKSGWRCARCNAQNASEAVFCAFCGRHRPQQSACIEEERREEVCPACGAACPAGAAFCSACGAALRKETAGDVPKQAIVPVSSAQEERVRCVHCGTMNSARNRFCDHCGQEVRVPAEQPQETLRSVSEVCPACGARCDRETAFCNECGIRLPDRGQGV